MTWRPPASIMIAMLALTVASPAWPATTTDAAALVSPASTRPTRGSTAAATSAGSADARASSSSGDFPDPFVLSTGGRYYAYATNVGAIHVPARVSVDLIHWRSLGDAVPNLPKWARSSDLTWAPSVLRVGAHFVMYLSVWDNRRGMHCIAVANASHAAGPFTLTKEPLVCGAGAIDASPFRASDGSAWLTWKFEATRGKPTRIVSRRLSGDGERLIGESAELVTPTQWWEDGVVEGPSMIYWRGFYFLFYAASDWTSNHYATGLAICASARGPCVKSRTPLAATTRARVSPGGFTAFRAHSHLYVAFHVWRHGVGYPRGKRSLMIEEVDFVEGTLRLATFG